MATDAKFKVTITGDAAGLVSASAQGSAAMAQVAKSTGAVADESERYAQALDAMRKGTENLRAGAAQEDAAIRARIAAKKQELALRKAETERGNRAGEAVEYAEALKRIGNDAKTMGVESSVAAQKGKLFGQHLGEMKKIVGQLSQEFPIAGLALRAFVNPIGAVAAVSIGAFVAAKQSIADYLALFKELPNVTVPWMKKFEDFTKVTAEGAKNWREYSAALNEALNPKKTTASEADKAVEALKAKATSDRAKLDRSSALADAQDELAVAEGRMTPAQATLRKAQRAEGYSAAKDRITAGATSGEIAIREAEKKRLADELAYQAPEARKKITEAQAADEAAAKARRDKDAAAERLANADKARAEADAAALPYESKSWMDDSLMLRGWRRRGREAAQGQRTRMAGAQAQAEEEFFQRAGMADRAGVAAGEAGAAAQAARADAVGTAQALTAVGGRLPALRSAAGEALEAAQSDAVIRALQTSTRLHEAQRAVAEDVNKRLAQLEAKQRQ
jgi:hypothetical protein